MRDVSRSDQQLMSLREGLVRGRSSMVYGVTKGGFLADMEPFHGTASRFLQEVRLETVIPCRYYSYVRY